MSSPPAAATPKLRPDTEPAAPPDAAAPEPKSIRLKYDLKTKRATEKRPTRARAGGYMSVFRRDEPSEREKLSAASLNALCACAPGQQSSVENFLREGSRARASSTPPRERSLQTPPTLTDQFNK